MKDWTGNAVSFSKTIGASNHTQAERGDMDYYATEPKAVRLLLELENFKEGRIWECACGEGHLSEEMKRLGYSVFSSDIVDRGYGNAVIDFLGTDTPSVFRHIITNPPYRFANQFISRALVRLDDGGKLALFLPIRYLEGKARKAIFEKYPPKKIYVSSSRLKCVINGDFDKNTGSPVCYAWFVWEKGYDGSTVLDWFN